MRRKLRLLAIDDDVPVQQLLKDYIDWDAHNIELLAVLGNGQAAIDYIKKNPPDVVLSDIKMPMIDGLELSHWISKNASDVHIILISAYSDFEYARQAINYGVEKYLLKPINTDELFDILSELSRALPEEIQPRDKKAFALIHYVDDNYACQLTLTSLGTEFYFTPSQVNRIFLKETHQTFFDYLVRIRMMHACKMLIDTDLKVVEIAPLVGYVNEKHFIRMFKKRYNIPPLHYRKCVHASRRGE